MAVLWSAQSDIYHGDIMADDSLIERKKRAFLEYFGDNPKFFDLYGVSPFTHKYEEYIFSINGNRVQISFTNLNTP